MVKWSRETLEMRYRGLKMHKWHFLAVLTFTSTQLKALWYFIFLTANKDLITLCHQLVLCYLLVFFHSEKKWAKYSRKREIWYFCIWTARTVEGVGVMVSADADDGTKPLLYHWPAVCAQLNVPGVDFVCTLVSWVLGKPIAWGGGQEEPLLHADRRSLGVGTGWWALLPSAVLTGQFW